MSEKITYYTTPDFIYDCDVDIIKGTSLTGREVDKNFNTLEGRSIRNITVSEDKKSIQINLLNGRVIECDNLFNESIIDLNFYYDSVCGELTVVINNDEERTFVIDGFLTLNDVEEIVNKKYIYTDKSLEGTGTIESPLKISRMEKTGVFKPVIDIVDELPRNANVGDRYIIVSEINKNGSLYNYKGVINIMKNLEGTGWSVAGKADWDDMLNALEPEKADRNHTKKDCNVRLGEVADSYLLKDEYGFNTTFCGYANEEKKKHVIYENERTIWWTSTNQRGLNAYIKRIDYDALGIYQDIADAENFYSVRLVRDINPHDTMSAEDIMGQTYGVTMMPSMKKGLRAWIDVNFNSELQDIYDEVTETTTETDCDGTITTITKTHKVIIEDADDKLNRFVPEEWVSEDIVYVCEWDGSRWIKNVINEHDTFYVINVEDFCRLENNQLIPINGESKSKIQSLEERVEKLENMICYCYINEILDNAIKYEYEDRPMVGSFSRKLRKIFYKPGSNVAQDILNDFARFFGSLHRASDIETLEYKGVTYEWNEDLGLKGSNFTSDGTLDGTLMKELTIDFQENPTGTAYIIINDVEVSLSVE